jgi:mono/diheme cytochrome c family protein
MLIALKTFFSLLLVIAGFVALFSMLALLGRGEKPAGPETLRATHRAAGYVFALCLLALVTLGAYAASVTGDRVSMRVVFHVVLALGMVVLLGFKILFARTFRQLTKHSAALGLTLFALLFVTASISAGFVAVTAGSPLAPRLPPRVTEFESSAAAIDAGELLFESHCASCHLADSDAHKVGPGLGGLWERGVLASSGEPVSEQAVRGIILNPAGTMPSFTGKLNEQELADLLAYLETL